MCTRNALICLALLLVAPVAGADSVNKCTGPDGKVTWSDLPCPEHAQTQVKQVNPNVLDSGGLRGWAARNRSGGMSFSSSSSYPAAPASSSPSPGARPAWASEAAAPAAPAYRYPSSSTAYRYPATPAGKEINSLDCENARRSYNFEAGYRLSKPAVVAVKRREVYEACGTGP